MRSCTCNSTARQVPTWYFYLSRMHAKAVIVQSYNSYATNPDPIWMRTIIKP